MTSWQNILDNLPTGTGRVTTQSNQKSYDDFNSKPVNNTNEGDLYERILFEIVL